MLDCDITKHINTAPDGPQIFVSGPEMPDSLSPAYLQQTAQSSESDVSGG